MAILALRQILGRPAFHAILAAAFGTIFVWPFFAIESPAKTFITLHVAWIACVAVLFAVSRGEEPRDDDDDAPAALHDEESN